MRASIVVVLSYVALAALVILAHGCAKCEYTLVGIKGAETAVVMNSCNGDLSLRNIPEDHHLDASMAKEK